MKRVALVLLILFVMALAGGQDAHGEELQSTPSVSEPIGGPLFASLEQTAKEYWLVRRITLPSTAKYYLIANEPEVAARGDEPGDRIWFTELAYSLLWAEGGSAKNKRIDFCMIYLHERGHNAGLEHYDGFQIMNGDPSAYAVVPPKCVKWAKLSFAYQRG